MALKRASIEEEVAVAEKRPMMNSLYPTVSVIIALYNAETYLEECLESILAQSYKGHIEISVHDDASTDKSLLLLENWIETHEAALLNSSIKFLVSSGETNQGAGAARNVAISQSSGGIIVIQDADDIALPSRIEVQVNALLSQEESMVLVGSRFNRIPNDATHHYTYWANNLSPERLHNERFRECTLIHPTWCYLRSTFDLVGGYPTSLGEDLSFFLQLGKLGAKLVKVEEALLSYRHVGNSLVSKTPRKHLLRIRVDAFQDQVLSKWCHGDGETDFVIWGAGRDGRDFLNALTPAYRNRVHCFLDVDEKKIGKPYHNGRVPGFRSVEVRHWRDAPEGLPVVLCVSLGRTSGAFEANVAEFAQSRNMRETVDYWHFI